MTQHPSNFSEATLARLHKIKQTNNVWEGDLIPLEKLGMDSKDPDVESANCIIWIDNTLGFVRAMELVPGQSQNETFVRALLKAIENPNPPGEPGKPSTILVKSREVQFFLRGILQPLGIKVKYVKKLDLIEQLIATFEKRTDNVLEAVGAQQQVLSAVAERLWEQAPWKKMHDDQIIQVEFQKSRHKKQVLYLCVMGKLGQEFGVIIYRSLDSLKDFRRMSMVSDNEVDNLEEIFMSQDCWFLNYENEDDRDTMMPVYGSIHPYEGMRLNLDDTEIELIYGAIEGLFQFMEIHGQKMNQMYYNQGLKEQFKIPLPKQLGRSTLKAKVSTMPDLLVELQDMALEVFSQNGDLLEGINPFASQPPSFAIADDLLPEGCIYSMGMIRGSTALVWEEFPDPIKFYQGLFPKKEDMEIPIISIQTSLPKAKVLIKQLQELGTKGITIAEGASYGAGPSYDLVLLQTNGPQLQLLGEFQHSKQHQETMKKWHRRCKQTKGHCAVLISSGVTGKARGNPTMREMQGLFELKVLDAKKDLGLTVLRQI